jgi:hypothetical protein
MSQNREARIRGLQAQLPLLDVESDEADRSRPTPSDQDPDWRLDAHTREVGRRGIAAARVHLRGATGRAA